jgi:hypothetical protein
MADRALHRNLLQAREAKVQAEHVKLMASIEDKLAELEEEASRPFMQAGAGASLSRSYSS